jgi:dethiobiotin synthetase
MNIFITATNTNVGKTYTTLQLIKYLSKKGYKVGVFKPIETGVEDTPLDGKLLFKEVIKYNQEFKNFTLNDIVPIQFKLPAAPIVAGEVDFNKIDIAYKKLKEKCDILLIEGAGGVKVPVTNNFYMFDFIKYFNAKTFLVIQSKLGCINDLELNLEFFKPDVWGINLFDDSFYQVSYPYLKEKYKEVLIIQKDLDKILKKLGVN